MWIMVECNAPDLATPIWYGVACGNGPVIGRYETRVLAEQAAERMNLIDFPETADAPVIING